MPVRARLCPRAQAGIAVPDGARERREVLRLGGSQLEPCAQGFGLGAGCDKRRRDRFAVSEAPAQGQGSRARRRRPQEEGRFSGSSGRKRDRGAEAHDRIQHRAQAAWALAVSPPRCHGHRRRQPPPPAARAVGFDLEPPAAVERMEEPRVLLAFGARPPSHEERAVPGHELRLEEELRVHRVGLERIRIGQHNLGERGDPHLLRAGAPVGHRDPADLQRAIGGGFRLRGRNADRDPPLQIPGDAIPSDACELDRPRLPMESPERGRWVIGGDGAEGRHRDAQPVLILHPVAPPAGERQATLGREAGPPRRDQGGVDAIAEDPRLRGGARIAGVERGGLGKRHDGIRGSGRPGRDALGNRWTGRFQLPLTSTAPSVILYMAVATARSRLWPFSPAG